ncbi:hypothetical protein B4U80_02008 [Leptotrombidium deliense]|uniref:Cytochrome c oxidase subunit 5B-like protein n=1 Tax=Leptotrombidium deliense TaxID=299467 RepID=A0A443SH09_9ACAR|nr:hypothetical protein B4U80_02008 [Leptotrombidium deliense]
MSAIIARLGLNTVRRTVIPSVRTFCDKNKEVYRFPDPIEHATGFEKQLRLLEEKGITDPFFLEPIKRHASTRDKPIQVPSFEERRLIGCVCEEDQTFVNYMWVHHDEPRRCECGYWFQCYKPKDYFADLTDD